MIERHWNADLLAKIFGFVFLALLWQIFEGSGVFGIPETRIA